MFDIKEHPNFETLTDNTDLNILNQSTTIGNTTVQHIPNNLDFSAFMNINNITNVQGGLDSAAGGLRIKSMNNHSQYFIPQGLKRTSSNDRKKDFHKKLQGKLETLIKKKDYQLLMQMTKNKIAQNMGGMGSILGKSLKGRRQSSDTSHNQTSSNILSPDSPNKNANIHLGKPGIFQLLNQSNSVPDLNNQQNQSQTQQQPPLHDTITSPTLSSSEDEDEEAKELQNFIAEGEGKLKRKNRIVSYETGTKSILCKRFVKLGQCPLGDKCEYAHSKKDLQFNSPQEWVELVKNISRQNRLSLESKSQMSSLKEFNSKYLGDNIGQNATKALLDAARMDDYRGIEFLIGNGGNPSAQDFKGNDALYYAVTSNSVRSLRSLIEYGGERLPLDRVYGKKKRNLMTVAAIYSQDIRILELLLNHEQHGIKFNTNQTDRFSRNAIFYSLFRNKLRAVQLFIQQGQSSLDLVDLRGMYLIDYALQYNFEEILLELVKGGARLGIKSSKGVAIMMYAASVGNFDLIKALMAKNIPLTSLSEDTGNNCLMVALQAGKYDLILRILDYIINIKAFNQQCRDQGETLLMKAISRKQIDLIKVFITKPGIQIGVMKDHQGKTELIHAVERNSAEIVSLLIEAARNSKQDLDMNNYDKRGRTAIIHATINQNVEILNLLLFEYNFPAAVISSPGGYQEQVHVVKWKDDLGKDVCDYAQTEEVKMVLAKYIEKSNQLYPGYFSMIATIQKKILQQKQKETFLSKVEATAQITSKKLGTTTEGDETIKRKFLDVQALKKIQQIENMKQKTMKNKLKRIEEEINAQSQQMKQHHEQAENEKIQILQQISKQRLKSLRSIALKFPKLSNLEHNPKFKQAITHLYEESDLSKFKNTAQRRTVNEILEHHSPTKVLKRYQTKKTLIEFDERHKSKYTLGNDEGEDRLQLPMLKLEKITSPEFYDDSKQKPLNSKNVLNIKETLTRIFSEDQISKFKSLTRSLDMNIDLDPVSSHNNRFKKSTLKTESSRNSEQQQYSFIVKDDKLKTEDYLPSIQSSSLVKIQSKVSNPQDFKISKAKDEAKKQKIKRIIKLAKLEDSDLEEEFQEEEEELMLLSKGKAQDFIREKIKQNFE